MKLPHPRVVRRDSFGRPFMSDDVTRDTYRNMDVNELLAAISLFPEERLLRPVDEREDRSRRQEKRARLR